MSKQKKLLPDFERGVMGVMASVPGWGARDFGKVLSKLGEIRDVVGVGKKGWMDAGISEGKAQRLEVVLGCGRGVGEKFNPESYVEELGKRGTRIVTVWDEEYPSLLADTREAPYVLFVRGMIKPGDGVAVAMVGTRKPTSYGREVTEKLAGELASYGVTVVSGLAYGVDAISQAAAVEIGGRTIGVLGNGIDQIQPAANRRLGERIIAEDVGAVVSEYAPGVQAFRQTFPARNRIISGMSLGVVVVEGTEKSGTLITAKFAQKQGRYLWAVPGPINSLASAAPNRLIKEGAIAVTGVEDILKKIKKQMPNTKSQEGSEVDVSSLTDGERKIWELLVEERSVDELVRESGLEAGKVLSVLTMMEIKGLARAGSGKYYRM